LNQNLCQASIFFWSKKQSEWLIPFLLYN